MYPHPVDLTQTIKVGSAEWFKWLAEHDRFVYREETGEGCTVRRETRRGGYFWYAHRRQAGKLQKVYLGKTADLTLNKLIAATTRLAGGDPTLAASASTAPFDLDVSLRRAVAGANQRKNMPEANIPFVLSARVTPPALPANLVNRPHLLQQINTSITLITAPSGFGKTTLLNQWRSERMSASREGGRKADFILHPSSLIHHPMAWVSLESEEHNAYMFWTTITTSLQQIDASIGETVSTLLQSPARPLIEHILANLIHNLNR